MGTSKTAGFTIIETVLFLSITGLLVMGALIGTGAAINNQRYRDATETFKGLLQQQYADLSNIHNTRNDSWGCNNNAEPVADGDQLRGQSSCLVVGKYLTIDQSDIKEYTLLARQVGSGTIGTEVDQLKANYVYTASGVESTSDTMEWQTQIAWPKTGNAAKSPQTPRAIAFLFLRSPISGSIFTFSSDLVSGNNPTPTSAQIENSMVLDDSIPGQGQQTVCVYSGGLMAGGDMSIVIGARSSSASSVEIRSNDYQKSIGESTRC